MLATELWRQQLPVAPPSSNPAPPLAPPLHPTPELPSWPRQAEHLAKVSPILAKSAVVNGILAVETLQSMDSKHKSPSWPGATAFLSPF